MILQPYKQKVLYARISAVVGFQRLHFCFFTFNLADHYLVCVILSG